MAYEFYVRYLAAKIANLTERRVGKRPKSK